MPSSNYTFTILDSVDSTNNYAMAKVHAGLAKHGDAFFAFDQTGGKGQRGKTWHTGNGQNIAISIIIEPKSLQVAAQFKLSAAVALACYDFFSIYAGEETYIKWPNDIYWRDRKAGGVLIENVIGRNNSGKTSCKFESFWKYAVIGIGININQTVFDGWLSNIVSLKQITGNSFDVLMLAKELHQRVLKRADELHAISFNRILAAYNTHLFKLNCRVKLKKGTVEFSTVIKGVTADGRLYTTDTIDNYFYFGEVEWIF
ncbi:MAG: biotin--[acetyl-CoA-carboxylase] ligase [Chitinophagaceae bacterium]|nr:biotin--[acetyl-CoA-carboxylase] ligase [Chitinophagaceae bacterium]